MEITLSNLKKSGKRKSKRLGRGDGSGKGTYSGRGLKGQRSRSGGKNKLKRRGLKQFLLQIPKSRGFRSIYASFQAVNLKSLNDKFNDGDLVNKNILLNKGLIGTKKLKVKILGSGEIKKKLNIWADSFSKTAESAINKAGGSVNIVKDTKKKMIEHSKKEKK
ncbi:MAG: 50S ribosomal protein L15 [bacterium]|nr:50S ribosomal protein L15 [bacterium]